MHLPPPLQIDMGKCCNICDRSGVPTNHKEWTDVNLGNNGGTLVCYDPKRPIPNGCPGPEHYNN